MISDQSTAADGQWAIAVHGGALGQLPKDAEPHRIQMKQSLERVLQWATERLQAGDSSLDVVEQVVRMLEDDPLFNAGRGAVLNNVGEHELDASIMDGSNLRCGAVAGVRTVKNPVSLARLVMEKTPHVLLMGPGAEAFADEMQVPREPPEYFRVPERVQEWQRLRNRRQGDGAATARYADVHLGTVGCVARDVRGHLAAATSTGGIAFKKFGRVGDSPIIGAGTYADDSSCAVSCTGRGEEFIRRAVAYNVSARMRYANNSLQEAVHEVIAVQLPAGSGGLIAVDRQGHVAIQFNTAGMARGWASSTSQPQVIVGP